MSPSGRQPAVNSPAYAVAATKPWNREIFDRKISTFPGSWSFFGQPEELTLPALERLSPRFVFFLHWSWKVPAEIFEAWECVVFHMTEVPYGRGGSPLQNLLERGHEDTRLSALRMEEEVDAGPVYLQRRLSLAGTAEQIYIRAAHLAAEMVREIVEEEPRPRPQTGSPLVFSRRKPHESRIPTLPDLERLYDFVRMLDAEGYPPAFLDHAGFRFELSRAALYHGRLEADVTIRSLDPKESPGKDPDDRATEE